MIERLFKMATNEQGLAGRWGIGNTTDAQGTEDAMMH